jgi:hypothetical protein
MSDSTDIQSVRVKASHLMKIFKALGPEFVDDVIIAQTTDGKVRVYTEETVTRLRPLRMTPRSKKEQESEIFTKYKNGIHT